MTGLSPQLQAQDAEENNSHTVVTAPSSLHLEIGEEVQLTGHVEDAEGNIVSDSLIFFTRARRSLQITTDGKIKALKPGSFTVIARSIQGGWQDAPRTNVPVQVAYPPVAEVSLNGIPNNLYAGTSLPVKVLIEDTMGEMRTNVDYTISSSKPSIATVDNFDNLQLHQPGTFTLTLQAEDQSSSITKKVQQNPTAELALSHNYTHKTVRTGDVVQFNAQAKTAGGSAVQDAPITYSYIGEPNDDLGHGSIAQIEQDGRFVANKPGKYTVMAKSGNTFVEHTFRAVPRNVQQEIEVVGQGLVSHTRTSDLWIWEGVDGRDYAVTGTWGGNGEAIFWDVTDPKNITAIDTVTVDARTVNDVKVNERGDIAVITREGASNRKNGIIILDVTDPSNVEILSEYNKDLTGGVHNTFIYEDHVYAVNNGRRYDIINIEDPRNPYTVNKFELGTPGHSIHDVWIEDGIAYSSNWSDGVVAVDIGSKNSAEMPGANGSPENPVQLGSYAYPSGWNHAAFPFKSESTGDFYVVAGDESFPYGLDTNGANRAAGWVHFIKFDDWGSPKEVARYKVPEAGSHNYWIEGDKLYAAFYNGGLRVVDISGELMGDLYEQGREIASFFPRDNEAFIPNATFTWGPQPYKGYIYLSDWNSGLWALKLKDNNANGTD